MRWEWGEERRSLQDGPRNDPGNPWRQATLGPVPCMLEVSGPGAHCKEHLNKGHRSELGSSRGNGDKSKKPKKTLVLSISIGLFMTIWKDSLLQFYSSSVVVPKIGTISAIEILKFVRNESNSLWSFSGHFFFFLHQRKENRRSHPFYCPFFSWYMRGPPFLLCLLLGTSKYPIQQWTFSKGEVGARNTGILLTHDWCPWPQPYTPANEPAAYSRQMGSLEAARGLFPPLSPFMNINI